MTVENIGVNSLLLSSCERGEHQSSRRATLLSGTALAAGVIAGMLFLPTGALAACSDTGGFMGIGNHTTNCTSTTNTNIGNRDKLPTVNIANGASITGAGIAANGGLVNLNATLNNNGKIISTEPNTNGVDVLGFGTSIGGVALRIGDATYIGEGNVTGAQNGVNIEGLDATATLTGGTIEGKDGDGIKVNAIGGKVTIPLIGTIEAGGNALVSTDGASVKGSNNGISASSIGVGLGNSTVGVDASTTVIVNKGVNNGVIEGTNGSGIFATSIAGSLGGSNSATTTVKGDATVKGGTIGILAGAGSLGSDANTVVDVSGSVTGGNVGVAAVAGSIGGDPAALTGLLSDPTNIANLASLAAGNGKATVDVKTSGTVKADDGVGVLAVGLGTGNEVSVDASGKVSSANGIGVLAGSIGAGGTVNVAVEDVSGGIAGVVGINTDGNTNVTATGNVEFGGLVGLGAIALSGGNATATLAGGGEVSSNGGLIGVAAISDGGNATINIHGDIDPPLIGGGAIALGSGTANALTSGAIDADLIGVVSLNIGNGRAVVDSSSALESSAGTGLVGLAGVKVGDQNSSGQPDVYIKNTGTIDDYQVGIAGVAVGKGNHIDINNRGDITAGLAGISGVAVGDDSKVTVSNRGDIVTGGTGIAAVTSGANGTITIANRGDIDAEIAGIIGVGAGDDSAVSITSRGDILTEGAGITAVTTGVNGVVSITNRGDIESGLAGVSGVAVGNDSTVFISNRGDINSGGAGLTAVATGENGTVNIRNRGDIDATLAGITGVAVGDNSKITVTNSGIITSEVAGITAVTTGEKGDINITNTDAIIAGLTGISGVAVGDGSKVSISTSGNVDAGVLGVAGFVDGKGGTVDVNTNALITSTGTGVLGGASGEGSKVNVTTHQAVSGDILGVGGVLVGDAHELNILTKDTVSSDHGIAVGATVVGDGNDIDIRTKVAIAGDLGGVDVVAAGDDNFIEINTENTVSSAHGIAIGSIIAGDDNLILVTPAEAVTGELGGVGIIAAGDRNIVDIETQGQVTSANGFGVMGVAIGDTDNLVKITTKKEVDGKYLGVGGTVGGDNSKLTILTEKDVNSSSGFGVAGLGIGDNQTVDIHTLAAVNGDGLGVGGQIVGQGTVTITTDGKVTSASGIGVSGGAVGDGPSDVKITTKDTVDGKLVGVAGNIGGDGSSLTITTKKAVTSSSGAGIAAASAGDGNSVDIHAEDSVSGDEAGVLALTFGDATDVEITTDGTVDASDGVGILATTIGNGGTLNITTGGAVTATASGIIGMNSGGSTDIQIGNTVTVESGGEFGAFALGGGLGKANIDVNGVISGAKTGAAALTIGSGDATVTSNQLVTASELGLGGGNIGTGNVILTNNAAIQSDGSGIAAVKAGASGSVEINVNADISGLSGSATGGDGVLVISSTTDLGTVDVALKDGVSIKSEESGINAIKLTGDGDVTIAVGEESAITAELAGVHAASMLGNGDVIITTGKDSAIRAGVGIAATKGLGTGDVNISLGEDSMIEGYIGVAANNLADDGNVQVTLNEGARVIAYRIGVEAGSIDGDVKLTADADTRIIALNGQAILAAAAGEVNISTAGLVLGDGSDTKAVVTIRSGDSANYHNQAGGVVASTDLDEAKLALDAKGGPITFINDGKLIGRVNLTSSDDVLHNNSSNSWLVSGVSDFGAGNDLLTNTGKIETSFNGAGGEYAEFRNLENFINGDLSGLGAGTLTMQGETYGLLGYDAVRDETVTGGNYTGIGNATLAVDAYLGQAGSTSDVLLVEGSTDGSTLVNVRDMNSGPGAYNPTGIKVVDVLGGAGSASNFSIDPMSANAMRGGHHVIDKGLFFYDMALVGAATIANPDRNQFRLIGVPDHEVFELPSLVSGAQSIWHETAGVWLDRQADLRNQLGSAVALPEGYVSKDGPISMPPSNGNVTPGVWAKAVGSWTDRDNGSSFSIHNNSYSYDTSYKQNTYGVIAGIDFGNEDVFTNGDAVIFGVMAGYLSSDLDFKASNTSADYSGGTVGLYGTYLNNGFFADALIKADFLKMDYSASSMGVSEKSDVNTYGFTLDTGYRFDLKNKLFLEPVATLSYAKTSIDDLTSIPGAYVAFPKNDSLRGSLGMRFGGEVAKNENYRMEASMTGRVWNEFNANNRADIHSGGSILKVSDDFKGAFGEIGGIINIHATSDKWSGFVSGSYKFNGDFKSGSVRGGVRLQW